MNAPAAFTKYGTASLENKSTDSCFIAYSHNKFSDFSNNFEKVE